LYPLILSDENLDKAILEIGCDPRSLPIFKEKVRLFPVKLHDIPAKWANIIKQEMLSCGGDAVVARGVLSCDIKQTDVLLLGGQKYYRAFIEKLKRQNYRFLNKIADELEDLLIIFLHPKSKWKIKDAEVDLNRIPILMGILNITDDSFSDGGKFIDAGDAVNHARKMREEGALIIDVGGESSRPGALPVDEKTESERVLPVVKTLKETGVVISVDTVKPAVAEKALVAGAHIINDIRALRTSGMAEIVAEHQAGVVLMHMQGDPVMMQKRPHYQDVIKEIVDFFTERIDFALSKGISEESIVLDPGIGFGKSPEHNLKIIRELSAFKKWGFPVLIGASRKSMIGAILDEPDPEKRLYGTLAVHAKAVASGANILRIHDVRAHTDYFNVLNEISA